jgi:hypothetical protein
LYFTSNASASTEYGYIQGRSTDLRIQGLNNGLILNPSGGNVGIGTSSPSAKLTVAGGSDMGIRIISDADGYASLQFGDVDDFVRGGISYNSADDSLQLRGYNNTERLRIDASGNVLVGKTATDNTTAGTRIHPAGYASFTIANDYPIIANRLSSDGDIAVFRKDGSPVGSIGSSSGVVSYIVLDPRTAYKGAGLTGASLSTSVGILNPTDKTGAIADNAINLGNDSARFHDFYLGGGVYANNASGAFLWNAENAHIAFGTNNSERMRIDSSGNLLVGKTSVSDSVAGGRISSDGRMIQGIDGTGAADFHDFYRGTVGSLTRVGNIRSSGTSVAYNTSSDYRLKEDWQPVENATDRLKELKPCNFAWKVDGSRVDGFLAHELQEVVPEAVTGEKDAMQTEEYEVTPAVYEDVVIPATEEVLDEEGNLITEAQEESTEQQLVSEAVMGEREVPDYQAIDQSKLVPLLVATIQELEARISALEA